jgi:hypothetical protein
MGESGDVRRDRPDTEWATAFAQARVDDEVVVAALCGPNAPGRWEFSSFEAFGQRQILKAQGRHHGERLVIALTAWQIHALSLSITGRVVEHLTWDRATACIVEVPLRAGVSVPGTAMFIGSTTRHQAIEVIEHGDGRLLTALLAGGHAHAGSRS